MTKNKYILKNILKNIDGAIFDLDGTLIDSMGIWDNIDKEYLEKRNIAVPQNLKSEIELLSFRETAEYFKSKFGISDSIDTIEKIWYNMAFEKYSNKAMLKPYAKNFLKLLKNKNIKIVLATSNYKNIAKASLKKNNIYELFDIIITTQDVTRGKNFSDIYTLAAKRINVDAERCIVFEDSLPAIKAAKLAKMKVIAVKDMYCPHDWTHLLQYSDAGIISFAEMIY